MWAGIGIDVVLRVGGEKTTYMWDLLGGGVGWRKGKGMEEFSRR